MATRMYNIVARYAEISGVKFLWPSKFELYFECDKCGHGMELPIKWDDKEYKLRTEKVTNINLLHCFYYYLLQLLINCIHKRDSSHVQSACVESG